MLEADAGLLVPSVHGQALKVGGKDGQGTPLPGVRESLRTAAGLAWLLFATHHGTMISMASPGSERIQLLRRLRMDILYARTHKKIGLTLSPRWDHRWHSTCFLLLGSGHLRPVLRLVRCPCGVEQHRYFPSKSEESGQDGRRLFDGVRRGSWCRLPAC